MPILKSRRASVAMMGALLFSVLMARPCLAAGPPPIIAVPPLSQIVLNQGSVTFLVVATSGTTMSYQWLKNGVNITGANQSSFTIASAQASDQASYSVKVTNAGGSVTSASATLTVVSAPGITTQPQSQTLTAGQNASFSVVANGTATLTYQWRFNGTAMSGASTSTLTSNSVQTGNAGNYTVVVANLYGSITSAVATLTVNVPPSISGQPQSLTVPVGQTASFSVLASGTATLRYQWRFNGAALAGATTSALTRANVQVSNAGSYTVVVTNSAGSLTSAVATLTVPVPPTIMSQPVSQTATQGLNASLFVTVSGSGPFGYQWQFSGTNLTGATNAALVLTNLQLFQEGNYVVRVTNMSGTAVSAPAFLTVNPPAGSNRPLAQGLVVHLTFDTDLTDDSGHGNDATAVGKPNLVPGFIGAGSFNPYTLDGTNNYATLGTATDLSFGKYTDFSIAFWARLPAGGWKGDPGYSDPPFISNKDWSDGNNDGWAVATGRDGRLQWNYTEGGGQTRKDYDGLAGVFGNPEWHHVAVTFQRGSNATTYLDGVPVSTNSIAPGNKSIDSGLPTNIGNDGTGDYSTGFGYWTNAFANPTNGLAMDDLGIWRRALAANEISAIYNVGLAGQDLATVTSADLTTVIRPRIIQSPVSLDVTAGVNAAFSVTANGTAPFAYQWFGNGVPIQGGTGPSLIISNVQPRLAGDYWVVITNSAGSATSSVATLTVTKPAILLSLANGAGMTPAGFTFQFSVPAGLTYVILASTDTQNWAPIFTNVAPAGTIVFTDTEAKNYNTRFYRLMVVQ